MGNQPVRIQNPPPHAAILVASHEKQIRGGQHSHCNTGIRKTPRDFRQLFGWRHQHLGDMADRDTSSVAEPLGQFSDIVNVHVIGGIAEIQVHVDIDVVRPRKFENAVDLCLAVAVVAWGRTDGPGTRSNASTRKASVSALPVRPSCGKAQISTSMAHA